MAGFFCLEKIRDMRRRYGKVGKTTLILFGLFSLILFLLETGTIRVVRTKYYEEKIEAVRLTERCFAVLKEEKSKMGIKIDSVNDPGISGLVGDANSPITVGREELTEVLLTTSPSFAALFVDVLRREGLKEGETVNVCLDGSFLGLNVSFFAAAQILGLTPFVTGSLTSSSWGANHPMFTWLDCERVLNERGLFNSFARQEMRFFSLGGEDDGGLGISSFGRELLLEALKRNPVSLLEGEAIPKKKASLYPKSGKVFLNIGNSPSASFLIDRMKQERKKVLDFSSPAKVIARMGISQEDLFLPIGKGRIYEERRYGVWSAVLFSFLILIALFFVIRYDIEYYLLPKKRREEKKIEEAI